MKAAFDACPEELREKHNALCDEAELLDTRVNGIIEGTFTGNIVEGMFHPELLGRFHGMATEESVAERLSTEQTARTTTDTSLESRIAALETKCNSLQSSLGSKSEFTTGTYSGNNAPNRFISVGFTPRAVFVFAHGTETSYGGNYCYGGLAISQQAAGNSGTSVKIESNGFRVYLSEHGSYNVVANNPNYRYTYIAFK